MVESESGCPYIKLKRPKCSRCVKPLHYLMCKENLTTLQQLGGIRNIYLHHLFTNLFRFWKVSGQLREKGD